MAIRFWSKEIAEARELIQKIIRQVDAEVRVSVDGGEGFDTDTFDVTLTKSGRKALAVVTVEACINASTDDKEMRGAFREIIDELESGPGPQSTFLVTTKGLARRPLQSKWQVLEDSAALIEAEDVKWPRNK